MFQTPRYETVKKIITFYMQIIVLEVIEQLAIGLPCDFHQYNHAGCCETVTQLRYSFTSNPQYDPFDEDAHDEKWDRLGQLLIIKFIIQNNCVMGEHRFRLLMKYSVKEYLIKY